MTHEELVRRARALVPAIRQRVHRAEAERRTPIESSRRLSMPAWRASSSLGAGAGMSFPMTPLST